MCCSLPRKRFTAVPFRRKMFLHLLCTHCERRLKNFIAFNKLLSESQGSLERVEKFMEKSVSAFRSLKTSKQETTWWPAFRKVRGGNLISTCATKIQSWGQVVMIGKFYGSQSCDLESFPWETLANTKIYFFCCCVLLSHFRLIWKGNTKLTSLLYFVQPDFSL